MDGPSLQRILREKYSITDRMLAEGRFVGLLGDHAANLVCLGLGMRCFVIAKVVLSGDVMDYDLISIIPISVLSLAFQTATKKLKVRSQFKATQVYQMCTSTNQAEVWRTFTSTIREVYMFCQGDTWCSTTLHLPYSSTESTASLHQISKDGNAYSSPTFLPRNGNIAAFSTNSLDFDGRSFSSSSFNSSSTFSDRPPSYLPKFNLKLSESSVSLPAKLSSYNDDKSSTALKLRRWSSLELGGVEFDSFVNGTADHIKHPADDTSDKAWTEMNMSNNYVIGDDVKIPIIIVEEVKDTKKETGIRRILKRMWSCCFCAKT